MAKEVSRSELRTLLTKAKEGLRIAKQNLDSVALIRDNKPRQSPEYRTANECYVAVKATFDQQEAQVNNLKERQKVVGNYGKKSKKTEDDPK